MKKLTQVQLQKILTETVDKVLNKGIDFNSLVDDLGQNQGVPFVELQKFENVTINKIGLEKGWILSDKQIETKVLELVKKHPLTHFLDVVDLANKIEIPQMSLVEKQNAIIGFSKIESSIVAAGKKFKQFNNNGYYGCMADWIREHKYFKPAQLHASNTVSAKNKDEYYDEVMAYFVLYEELYGVGSEKLQHLADSK